MVFGAEVGNDLYITLGLSSGENERGSNIVKGYASSQVQVMSRNWVIGFTIAFHHVISHIVISVDCASARAGLQKVPFVRPALVV